MRNHQKPEIFRSLIESDSQELILFQIESAVCLLQNPPAELILAPGSGIFLAETYFLPFCRSLFDALCSSNEIGPKT